MKPSQEADIQSEIAAHARMRAELESKHMGKWVLFKNQKLVSVYESFDAAAEDAVRRFGRSPFLLRQVGAPPMTMPASSMYPV